MRAQSRAEIEASTGHVADANENAILMRCLDDYYVWGLKTDASLTPCILYSGHWEAWITSWFTHNINEGDFIIDVGANCGYFTMLFERMVGVDGQVWAYECNPAYVELLEATADYNSALFTIHPYAVSDEIGQATLTFPGQYTGSASLRAGFDPKYGEHTKMVVETTTLDNDLKYTDRKPNLIKLDIESAEELAWDGMSELLNSDEPPVVVLEYTPHAYSDEFNGKLFNYGDVSRIGFDGKEESVTKEYLDTLTDWDMLVIRKKVNA